MTDVFQSEEGRSVYGFASIEDRWRRLLARASQGLSDEGRVAFHRTLTLLGPGNPPRLLPDAIEADDVEGFEREADHMPRAMLTKLGVLVPSLLGFNNPETALVQRLYSAVHRLVRIANARS